ncbi:MAG: hypothetical protein HYZ28_02590 [Myxococcales bacterium]|nr:hypothetical protein [Myxococcales bacterium]
MRAIAAALLLSPFAALAHGTLFTFLAPDGVGNLPDGGMALIRWSAYEPLGTVMLDFYASRRALSGWPQTGSQAPDVLINPTSLLVADAGDTYAWVTSAAPAGCYQPYAMLRDPVEGDEYVESQGKVTVPGPSFVPPAVWIANTPGELVDPYGTFEIRFRVHDPDSATSVSLKYRDATGVYGIAEGLELPDGGGEGRYPFSVAGIPKGLYQLYARAEAPNEPPCETTWRGMLWVPGGPYLDAGVSDGGRCSPGGCGPCAGCEPAGQCRALPAGSAGDPPCAPFACGGDSAACPTSCTSDAHCAAGRRCRSSVCLPEQGSDGGRPTDGGAAVDAGAPSTRVGMAGWSCAARAGSPGLLTAGVSLWLLRRRGRPGSASRRGRR